MKLFENQYYTNLPGIVRAGGDTTELIIAPVDQEGCAYRAEDFEGCTARLSAIDTLDSVIHKSAIPEHAPLFIIKGEIAPNDNGDAMIKFKFQKDDTLDLEGVYIYQIDIENSETGYARVLQGNMTILKNIRRSFS